MTEKFTQKISRREFLRKAGLSLAALLLTPIINSCNQSPENSKVTLEPKLKLLLKDPVEFARFEAITALPDNGPVISDNFTTEQIEAAKKDWLCPVEEKIKPPDNLKGNDLLKWRENQAKERIKTILEKMRKSPFKFLQDAANFILDHPDKVDIQSEDMVSRYEKDADKVGAYCLPNLKTDHLKYLLSINQDLLLGKMFDKNSVPVSDLFLALVIVHEVNHIRFYEAYCHGFFQAYGMDMSKMAKDLAVKSQFFSYFNKIDTALKPDREAYAYWMGAVFHRIFLKLSQKAGEKLKVPAAICYPIVLDDMFVKEQEKIVQDKNARWYEKEWMCYICDLLATGKIMQLQPVALLA